MGRPHFAAWPPLFLHAVVLCALMRRACKCPVRLRAWLTRRHAGADFGAQLVDQLEAVLGLDMPEGPAVAGFRALRYRAHAVDRADLVAEHDGAVGPHQGAVTLPGVDEFGAGQD